MKPHELRDVEERTQLGERLAKLNAFLTTNDTTQVVSGVDLSLLQDQQCLMASLLHVLDSRIERFKLTKENTDGDDVCPPEIKSD